VHEITAELAVATQTSNVESQPKPDGLHGCPSAGSLRQSPDVPGGSVKMQMLSIAHCSGPLMESQGIPTAIFAAQVDADPGTSLQ
jgi:hypothetical protein